MFKKVMVRVTLILGLLLGSAGPTLAAETVDAKAGLAVDAQSGQILFDQSGSEVLPIGSMTKLLTVYLTLNAIKQGKLSWDTQVPVSALAYKLTQDTELTNVPLTENGQYSVRDLYDAALIQSANSAAMMLGDAFAGSQTAAVKQMRAQLQQWGITDAYIVNLSGLNNSYLEDQIYPGSAKTDENKMSAADMAIVAQHLLTDFPEVLNTTKQTSMEFAMGTSSATTLKTWNNMLPGQTAADANLPVDGLKTGTTDLAGACFTGTVKKDGRRIITVVMHANQNETDSNARFVETAKIMNSVYDTQSYQNLAKGSAPANQKRLPVKFGTQTNVAVGLAQQVGFWLPKTQAKAKLTYKVTAKTPLTAPVAVNKQVGTAQIKTPVTLRYLPGQTPKATTVTTQKAVNKLTGFDLFKAQVVDFF
ncbi:serine hydrolase [Loigolactobacillus zhaoyuanensis]|uniref:serine-type D-Ala-D-Ala carboxypeptidase n=1 Tax=Loigolactobacillus zhaoyuanensis TaxID=2486017 RepID=A0ABW8UCQ8_9LACO|nr:serine hydrolase [Loigolactobacillus zhaoyuanensis]